MNEINLFKALNDETRLKIIKCLIKGERCVCEIIPCTKRTQSTVSIQLSKLESLNIISSRRDGKCIYYKLNDKDNIQKIIELAQKVN
jgi:DNA-binding transcriptional ArsR family regulator